MEQGNMDVKILLRNVGIINVLRIAQYTLHFTHTVTITLLGVTIFISGVYLNHSSTYLHDCIKLSGG